MFWVALTQVNQSIAPWLWGQLFFPTRSCVQRVADRNNRSACLEQYSASTAKMHQTLWLCQSVLRLHSQKGGFVFHPRRTTFSTRSTDHRQFFFFRSVCRSAWVWLKRTKKLFGSLSLYNRSNVKPGKESASSKKVIPWSLKKSLLFFFQS